MAGPAGATASQGTPGQLGGQWWKWAFSMPADDSNPLNGGDCMNGQADNGYLFLSGVYFDDTVPGADIAQRDCSVPAGRPLFFPVVNTECSSIEVGSIWGGTNAAELAACLAAWSFEGTATLDGEELDLVTAMSGVYRIAPLPDPNLLAAPAGTSGVSRAAGLYGWTAPLAAGEHELSFIGTASYDGRFGGDPFAYQLAVDYTITAS
jgi:hypothetical protein